MLEAAFTERTRYVVLNNPQNPAGVVLSEPDLALLLHQLRITLPHQPPPRLSARAEVTTTGVAL